MKPSFYHKIISLMLSFIFIFTTLTGCTSKTDTSEKESTKNPQSQEESLPGTEADITATNSLFTFNLFDNDKTYSSEDLNIQKEFENYLQKIFMDVYENSTISVNFLIENPENYGIEKLPSVWTPVTKEIYESSLENSREQLEELQSFSYEALTHEQQYIYDNLKKSLEEDCSIPEGYLFDSAFSLDGIPSQLPLIMTEFEFRTKEDIEDYLGLLETLNDFMEQNLSFEHYRMEQGHFLSTYSYESTIKQCETFLEQGEGYLTTIFANKLDEFKDLTKEERAAYIERNSQAVKNAVIPAYHNVIDTLTEYMQEGTFDKGLCDMEGGKDYYNYLLKSNVGTSKTAEELIELLDENIAQYQANLSKALLSDLSLITSLDDPQYIYSKPNEILTHLSKMIAEDFPNAVCESYTLKDIDAAMADELSVAFYILSPIDNFQHNIIYVNQDRIGEGNDLFPTLAHEGLPGHMYQHNYFCSTSPNYFRSLFSFTGYSEGWAEYVELYSYDWSGLDENMAEVLKINTLLSDALPTRIDLGINYEGWDLDDTADYLKRFGIDDTEIIEIYYNTVISAPTVFFTYYVGYLELAELKETAMNTLGDLFYIKDFHKFILEIGPSYFDLIDEQMQLWMTKIQNQAKE